MKAIYGAVLLAGIVLGCGDDGTGPSCGSGTATAVNVCDNFFAPASSPITAGANIMWTWEGRNPHTVTFEDGQGSSGEPKTAGSHARSFTSAGTFRYRCIVHSSDFNSGMVGSVTVQ